MTLHITCSNNRSTLVTENAGLLKVDETCEINSNLLSIPAHTNIKTHMIEVQVFNSNTSYIPLELLQETPKKIERLQQILNMTIPNEPIDLNSVQNRL